MNTKVAASAAPDREEMAAAGMRLVGWMARDVKHLPPGLDVEELESIGGEAVARALETFDPACGLSFVTHARGEVRRAMQRCIGTHRTAAKRRVAAFDTEDGQDMGLAEDQLAGDPADLAAERLDPKPAAVTLATSVASELTDPRAVARRAAELRAEVIGAFKPGDVQMVMRAMIKAAQHGDPRCARLLLDVLGVGTPAE